MRLTTGITVGLMLTVSGCSTSMDMSAPMAKAQASTAMAHAHIAHVSKAWGDTPQGMGLLPVALAEAKTAVQHAGFAASKPDDLGWMQLHSRHVLHAVDPAAEPKGPGLGYGVIKAAAGTIKHIKLAAKSEDASNNVKAHAVHVATSAENALTRAEEITVLAKRVIASSSAAEAYPLVQKIQQLATALNAGVDADGDGVISWQQDEGGLLEADKHLGFMIKGEGIN